MFWQFYVPLDDSLCGITDDPILRGTQSIECKSLKRNLGCQLLFIRTLQHFPPIIITFPFINIIFPLEVIPTLTIWTLEFLDFPLDVCLKLLELLVGVLVFLEHIKEFLGFFLIFSLLLNGVINCEGEIRHFRDLNILDIFHSDFLFNHYVCPYFPLQTEFGGSLTNLFTELLFLTLHFSLFLIDRLFQWLLLLLLYISILLLVKYSWFYWWLWFLQQLLLLFWSNFFLFLLLIFIQF